MDWLTAARWSPYAAGIGIGILSWLTFLISKKPLGCSTAFASTSGMIRRLFRGAQVAEEPYYKSIGIRVDWQWMLVLGIAIGAYFSAWTSGDFALTWAPARWAQAFGPAVWPRLLTALDDPLTEAYDGANFLSGLNSADGAIGDAVREAMMLRKDVRDLCK